MSVAHKILPSKTETFTQKKKSRSPSAYFVARDEYFETSRLQKLLRKGGDYGPVIRCEY